MYTRAWIFIVPLLIGIGLFWWMYDWDGRRIHKRMDQLVRVVEKQSGDGPLTSMAKSQQLVGFFTPEARLRLAPVWSHTLNRREWSSLFHQAHARLDELSLRITDRHITHDRPGERAHMRFTARGTIAMGGQRDTHVHEFHLQWERREREWYIDEVDILHGIRAPTAATAP